MRPTTDEKKFLKDWKFVEVARYVDSLSKVIREKKGDDPLVIPFDQVQKYSDKHNNVGVYTSVWLYNNEDINKATRYSNLYFDLDNSDIAIAYEETLKLVSILKNKIPEQAIKIYFTGKKGFHIECEGSALGVTPSNDLHVLFRFIASDIRSSYNITSLDLSVYDARRMWRLPGSKHQSTGLYKTLLTIDEFNSGLETIFLISRNFKSSEYQDVDFDYKSNEWYREYSYKMEADKERSKDYLSYFNKHGSKGLKQIDDSPKVFSPHVLFKNCPAIKRIYQEAKEKHDIDHESRLFLCSILTYTDDSIELLHEILSHCSDYNVQKSTSHINDWIRRREIGIGGRPYTCERANSVGVGCGDCQLEGRKKWVKVGEKFVETNVKSSPSPIRFAYRSTKKEKKNE